MSVGQSQISQFNIDYEITSPSRRHLDGIARGALHIQKRFLSGSTSGLGDKWVILNAQNGDVTARPLNAKAVNSTRRFKYANNSTAAITGSLFKRTAQSRIGQNRKQTNRHSTQFLPPAVHGFLNGNLVGKFNKFVAQ